MKKSFLLLTLVVAVSISALAKSQNGGTHQQANAGSHKTQGYSTSSRSHSQQQALAPKGSSQQKGHNANMAQGNQGQMNQSGHGSGNTSGTGNGNMGQANQGQMNQTRSR